MVRFRRFPFRVLSGVMMVLCTGCISYHSLPITAQQVAQALRAPSRDEVRLAIAELKHPILKPVAFSAADDGFSPEQAAVFAVLVNPTLRSVRDARALARAQIIQAGILPNPQVSASLDLAFGNSVPGVNNAYGLSGSWEVTALFARTARIEAARTHEASVDLSVAWQEWQVAEAAKQGVYQLVSLQKQVGLARQIEGDLTKGSELLRQAVGQHQKTETDLAPAEAAANQAQADRLLLEQQQTDARLALNQTLGLPPTATVRVRSGRDLPDVRSAERLAAEAAAADYQNRRLDLIALRLGYQSQEATLRAAVRGQFPKISLGITRASDNAELKSLGPNAVADLPFFDRNQGNIAIEKATRQQLLDEYTARVYEARADIAKAAADLRFTAQRAAAASAAIPNLERLAASYGNQLNQGRVDVLVVYEARQSANAKRLEQEKLEGDLAGLMIAVELATGTPLFSEGR